MDIYGLEYKLADTQNNALFEIEFIKNRNVYRYFIELNKKAIVREEAYYNELQADKREKCLFKRTLTEFNSPCGIDKNIAEQTIKTRLLVSELINNRNTQNKFIHDNCLMILGASCVIRFLNIISVIFVLIVI